MSEKDREVQRYRDREFLRQLEELRRPLTLGYGRPREREHDEGLSDTVKAVERDIKKHGGRVLEVANELQIRQAVGRRISEESYLLGYLSRSKQRDIAEEFGLKVIDGHIRIPDVELLVERRTGDRERVQVEYASHHYHAKTVGQKIRAGFVVGRAPHSIKARRAERGRNIIHGMISH